jgi:phenylalanyl-tRNA synthetase alpha chain
MNLHEHLAVAEATIQAARTVADLDEVEKKLLGRNSPIGEARRGLGKLDPSERPGAGAEVNRVSAEISGLVAQKRAELERATADLLLVNDSVDVTVERWTLSQGTEHLVQQTIDEVCNIFIGLGYRVEQGPEAELAWFNFDALNTPPHHPSRFESDTLYLDFGDPADEVLLRTHTSPMQVRYMQSQKPPLYVVVPGKTFRSDTIDASHLPVFHQIEGLAVDSGIVFSDLKGTLAHFAREFFGREQRIRLRPSFFPFTEPSAELDVSCFVCGGAAASCRLCGGSGWLEMAGCGMVDPNVLDMAGHDSQTLSGFAFGMGVERLAMVRHGISNIRVFIDNDLRALRQFR